MAIYARENGQGMVFLLRRWTVWWPAPSSSAVLAPVAVLPSRVLLLRTALFKSVPAVDVGDDEPPAATGPAGGRPSLKRVK